MPLVTAFVAPGKVVEVDASSGSVLVNHGADTIYYGTDNRVTSVSGYAALAASASVTLSGKQWLAVASDAATSRVTLLPLNEEAAIESVSLGGVSSVEPVRLPVTFADLVALTPVHLYTPAVGDRYLGYSYIEAPVPFDGTTPRIAVWQQGEDPATGTSMLALSSFFSPSNYPWGQGAGASIENTTGDPAPTFAQSTTPWVVILDDGSGGDPGSMAGEAEIVLFVIGPPA